MPGELTHALAFFYKIVLTFMDRTMLTFCIFSLFRLLVQGQHPHIVVYANAAYSALCNRDKNCKSGSMCPIGRPILDLQLQQRCDNSANTDKTREQNKAGHVGGLLEEQLPLFSSSSLNSSNIIPWTDAHQRQWVMYPVATDIGGARDALTLHDRRSAAIHADFFLLEVSQHKYVVG